MNFVIKNFPAIIKKLVGVLHEMGIETTAKALENASLSSIHYAKDIPLTDGPTLYHFINNIKEANIKISLGTNQTDYRNDGHSYKWHCNSYEVVFYDKIHDSQKARISSKRADCSENSLLSFLRKKKKFEILRMEVRLNTRKKIKQLFKALGIKSDLTFKKLFKPAIAKKVLLYYFDEIVAKRPPLLDYKPANEKALLAELIFNNPELRLTKIMQLFGLKIALNGIGFRELRVMLARYNQKAWYKLLADANKVNLSNMHQPLDATHEQLIVFKLLRIK